MLSPLLSTVIQYGGVALIGTITGFVFKGSSNRTMHKKMQKYQMDLVKCQSVILQLESENRQWEKRVAELESRYSTHQLFMN